MRYILDACAVLAALKAEKGADVVEDILTQSEDNIEIYMHKINMLEVYYDVYKYCGKEIAEDVLAEILENPIEIIADIDDEVFAEAGRLKATYRISLADAIALAETVVLNGELVTSDHHEFDVIEQSEDISFLWIR